MRERNLYSDAERYDLVMGEFAVAPMLDFYRRQVSLYGGPVLELACGTGRLTIPLAESGVEITGLDISPQMLELAEKKAQERSIHVTFVRGDVRAFSLDRKFGLILIPAQSLSHLHERDELEACFACVRRHLAEEGRFLIEIFNPSIQLLARSPHERYPVGRGEYESHDGGERIFVTSQVRYDAATQINHIQYIYRQEQSGEESLLSFEMRQFFPREIDALLAYNGFHPERKFGDYDETTFGSYSPKQLIVCRDVGN